MKIFLCSVILVSVSSCRSDEDLVESFTFDKWETFTTGDGLGSDSIWDVLTDREGNIWIATFDNGVTIFDGENWSVFNSENGLPSDIVYCIEEDQAGWIWLGTDFGFSIYDGTRFNNFTGIDDEIWTVTAFKQSESGIMYIGTYGHGLYWVFLNGDVEGHYDIYEENANYIYSIDEDTDHTIWAGTDAGAYKISSSVISRISENNGLSSNHVRSVLADSWGDTWFGMGGLENNAEFVTRYDGVNFYDISLFNGLDINQVYDIFEDSRGNIWFGLIGGGVVKYDGASMRSFFKNNGLAGNSVTSITEDNERNMWFGTLGDGLTRYKPAYTYQRVR